MPLCFSRVQVDLDPEVTARRSQIIIERHRASTPARQIPVPLIFPPPPPVYPSLETQYVPQCTHTETQVIVAAPQEREPTQTILNINIEQAASEIAEKVAKENMLRNRVAVLENSLDEERRARSSGESASYHREVREIYEARETRHRSRSGGEHSRSRCREEHRESRSREVSVEYEVEEKGRRRISHEYRHRSGSLSRHASPRSSGDRLMIMAEHSSPRHSSDRLEVTHARHHSHEIRYHKCSFCHHHGHESSECSGGEQELLQVPVRRVKYWQV